MNLKHNVQDADSHFIFNPATRSWTYKPTKKRVLIQGDHNSEVFTFEFPRLIEGHDMSKCDAVQVHYINIDEVTRAQSCGVFEVNDVQALSGNADTLTCSWLISNNATKYRGGLSFLLRFACFREDGTLYYDWHSAIFSGVVVAKGINNGDIIVAEYPDILEQWKREIIDSGGATPELIEAAVGAYLEEHPIDAAYVKKVNGKTPDANGAVTLDIDGAVETALAEAKASGTFDGKDGKDGEDGYTPVKGVDYFDGKDGKDGKDGEDGYTPVKGVDYFDGKDGVVGRDGYTPVKGIDYFDGKDGVDGKNGVDGRDGVDGRTPVKGIDYVDGKDGEDGYTPVKGVDYFDGKNGKDAYTYAKESGYTGTEAQFAAKLAAEMPTVLKNPHALTFTGGASGKYDGSEAKTVNIPTVPTALKNPHALTINGEVYDGSSEVNVSVAKAPLIGTASGVNRVTPQQVAEAVLQGRAVVITYPISGFECTFNSFDIRDNTVLGEILMPTNKDNNQVNVILIEGSIDTNIWEVGVTGTLARMNDIPKMLPNPHKLTINGKEYDGSKEVSVNITGGDTDADWIATSEQIGGAPVFNAVDLPFTWSSYYLSMNNKSFRVNVGVEYDVDWEGTKYVCTPFEASGELFFGNADLQTFESVKEHPLSNKNAPFLFSGSGDTITMVTKNSTTAENIDISVTTHAYTVYNKLPKEYLPDDIGGNIDVTAEVGQTIVVEEVDGNGKPTKWRAADFQEKICGTEFVEVQPLIDIEPYYNERFGVPVGGLGDFTLTVGNKYKVTFDGVEYSCTAFMASMGGMSAPAIGNTAVAGGTNTGEPFAIYRLEAEATAGIILFDMDTHSVRVEGEVVSPISTQYLGNALPYYIEVTGEGVVDDPYVCNDTVANVNAIVASGRPIMIKNIISLGEAISSILYFTNTTVVQNITDAAYGFATMNAFSTGAEVAYKTIWLRANDDGTFAVSTSISD